MVDQDFSVLRLGSGDDLLEVTITVRQTPEGWRAEADPTGVAATAPSRMGAIRRVESLVMRRFHEQEGA